MRIRSWNYSSMEPLYRGPLGIVSKARCETKGGRFDAVTQLDPRLEREVIYAALDARMSRVGGLRSPLLVRDKGLVEVNGEVCLASVLVDGVPLRFVVGQDPLPPRVACGVAAQVARALHTAYDRLPRRKRRAYGLIHGDLGPADVIVGDQGDLRVANVGRRAAGPHDGPDPLRALVPGPSAWTAPEVGDQPPSHASDVYSLMAMLAWMVTGQVPGYASSEADWHEGVVESVTQRMQEATDESALAELVSWGMSFSPTDRPRAEVAYGWLDKLSQTLPGPNWQSYVGARLGSAQADAIEALVGLDEGAEDLASAPPPPGLDWSPNLQVPPAGEDPDEIPWDQPADEQIDQQLRPRSHVASVVVDPQRRALDLAAVLPRAETLADPPSFSDEFSESDAETESESQEFEALSAVGLSAPRAFRGLQEVSASVEDFAIEAEDEDALFEMEDESDCAFELDSEETEQAGMLMGAPDSAELPVGGTIRIQVGGRGRSSWGRDDLRDVSLPDHLFKDGPTGDPTELPSLPRAPLRGIRVTMPAPDDKLDGFVFEGSEEDAIAATEGRARQHLRLVSGEEEAEDDPSTEALAAAPAVPAARSMARPASAHARRVPAASATAAAPPRPARDEAGSPFLWAVGLGSAVILAIMALNPIIQSWRAPLPMDKAPVRPSASLRHASPSPSAELGPAPVVVISDDGPVEPLPEEPDPVDPVPADAAAAVPLPPPVEAESTPPARRTPPKTRKAPARSAPPATQRRRSRSRSEPPPAARTAPEEAPKPAVPEGTVVVKGDAASVQLVGPTGRFSGGTVPAGTYTIFAAFGPGMPAVDFGSVVVPEGGSATVMCNATFMACKVR